MKSNTNRLDRFISQNSIFSISDTRLLIAQKRIILDGQVAYSIQQKVTKFTHVVLDGNCLNDKNNSLIFCPGNLIFYSFNITQLRIASFNEHFSV